MPALASCFAAAAPASASHAAVSASASRPATSTSCSSNASISHPASLTVPPDQCKTLIFKALKMLPPSQILSCILQATPDAGGAGLLKTPGKQSFNKKTVRIDPIIYDKLIHVALPKTLGLSCSDTSHIIHERASNSAASPMLKPSGPPAPVELMQVGSDIEDDDNDNDEFSDRRTQQTTYSNADLSPGCLSKWNLYYVHMWREYLGMHDDPWMTQDLLDPAQQLWDKIFSHILYKLEARHEVVFTVVLQ
ncbi:hypothetical protein EWM64_g9991 [Hericium alpestre]|uniref:Uncharacterized protein n=1 Tax=Hericium alpestre TaxID=135208 RepID=A0A4Y9ZJJ3_9AGAM|nr:hypothetical protein EWM64_g9991 [Hericium alpestre]